MASLIFCNSNPTGTQLAEAENRKKLDRKNQDSSHGGWHPAMNPVNRFVSELLEAERDSGFSWSLGR